MPSMSPSSPEDQPDFLLLRLRLPPPYNVRTQSTLPHLLFASTSIHRITQSLIRHYSRPAYLCLPSPPPMDASRLPSTTLRQLQLAVSRSKNFNRPSDHRYHDGLGSRHPFRMSPSAISWPISTPSISNLRCHQRIPGVETSSPAPTTSFGLRHLHHILPSTDSNRASHFALSPSVSPHLPNSPSKITNNLEQKHQEITDNPKTGRRLPVSHRVCFMFCFVFYARLYSVKRAFPAP